MYLRNAMAQHHPGTDFQLRGFWLYLARGIWISFILYELFVIVFTLLTTGGQGLTICPFLVSCAITPATAQALHHLSIAPSSYVTYNLVLALLLSLVFLIVGGFLFWRKSSQPIGLVTSFFLVSVALSPFMAPSTEAPFVVFSRLGPPCIFGALGYFLVAFPDGRFVPRWSWVLVVLWIVQAIFYGLYVIPGPFNLKSWPPVLFALPEVLIYGATVAVLVYRYVRVFSPSQRQQAKWLLFGFAGLIVMVTLYTLLASLFPPLAAPDSLYQLAGGTITSVMFLLMPLSLVIAIQSYRLWDIDVLIRRTLVYTILTAILALIYFGCVVLLQRLVNGITGQAGQSPLVIVASTLAIAALFSPLRRRIQKLIDRRFYRRRYDAAKIVEAFSATLRNEVDLNELRERLITLVQDTMQPEHVSLWLPPVEQQLPWRRTTPVGSNEG